jgi:hypothetical protein
MTPLEYAASASWNATRAPMSATWDELAACQPGSPGARCQDRHRAIVRAALAATREASDQMIDAIHSTHRPGWDVSWRYIWETMLDALLAEQPEPPTPASPIHQP